MSFQVVSRGSGEVRRDRGAGVEECFQILLDIVSEIIKFEGPLSRWFFSAMGADTLGVLLTDDGEIDLEIPGRGVSEIHSASINSLVALL